MNGPQPVGQLAELAVNRAIMASLRERLADAQAIADRRAREGFAAGVQRGRAARPIGFLFGMMLGATATGLFFVVVW